MSFDTLSEHKFEANDLFVVNFENIRVIWEFKFRHSLKGFTLYFISFLNLFFVLYANF